MTEETPTPKRRGRPPKVATYRPPPTLVRVHLTSGRTKEFECQQYGRSGDSWEFVDLAGDFREVRRYVAANLVEMIEMSKPYVMPVPTVAGFPAGYQGNGNQFITSGSVTNTQNGPPVGPVIEMNNPNGPDFGKRTPLRAIAKPKDGLLVSEALDENGNVTQIQGAAFIGG